MLWLKWTFNGYCWKKWEINFNWYAWSRDNNKLVFFVCVRICTCNTLLKALNVNLMATTQQILPDPPKSLTIKRNTSNRKFNQNHKFILVLEPNSQWFAVLKIIVILLFFIYIVIFYTVWNTKQWHLSAILSLLYCHSVTSHQSELEIK